MNVIRGLKRKVKKLEQKCRDTWRDISKGYFEQKSYYYYLEKLSLDSRMILAESKRGKELEWNITELLREFSTNPRYKDYTICVAVVDSAKRRQEKFLRNQGIRHVRVIIYESREYYKLLATAGTLISDSSFLPAFIKREGQKYLNIWNTTEVRAMGKNAVQNFGMIGNMQRNLLAADYLMFANEFSAQRVEEDYMLANLAQATVLLTGYPRNEVLFDEEKRQSIREKFSMAGKKNFIYYPVRRAAKKEFTFEEQRDGIVEQLWKLDKLLPEDICIYAKVQDDVAKYVDWGGMSHIKPCPRGFAAYELLGAADGLITDYSSVLFDYAPAGRPVFLFMYDKEAYLAHNGFAVPMDEIPFPKAFTAEELVECLKKNETCDSERFAAQFCPRRVLGTAKAVCARVIFGEAQDGIEERRIADNGKKNVAIFGGDFRKNGITTSLLNLLNELDRTKYNYIIVYKTGTLRARQDALKELPDGVAYLGLSYAKSLSLLDTIQYNLRFYSDKRRRPLLEKQAERDVRRIFSDCRIDKVVQFNGYVNDVIMLFEKMPCSSTIYVHNDMEQEMRTKNNVNRQVLCSAYLNYDSVGVVTPDLIPVTQKLARTQAGKTDRQANIVITKNIINYKNILKRAGEKLDFDEETQMNVDEARLCEILESDAEKFITIGRFSPEKGHFRLIDAFEKLHEKNPDTYLIILGGYGDLYEKTLEKAAASKAAQNIIVIYFMSNPFPMLKQCDYFVLSSFYEGFGLVLAEADLLGVRCISTDVVGPKLFMEQYGGYLMENSEQGILKGMQDCLAGLVPEKLLVDYEQYNREAVEQFEALLP